MHKLKRCFGFVILCGLMAWGIDWVSYPMTTQPTDFLMTYLYVLIWTSFVTLIIRKISPKNLNTTHGESSEVPISFSFNCFFNFNPTLLLRGCQNCVF